MTGPTPDLFQDYSLLGYIVSKKSCPDKGSWRQDYSLLGYTVSHKDCLDKDSPRQLKPKAPYRMLPIKTLHEKQTKVAQSMAMDRRAGILTHMWTYVA